MTRINQHDEYLQKKQQEVSSTLPEIRKKDLWKFPQTLDISGAGERTRTSDLLITSQLLYQLSYTGKQTIPFLL